MSTSTDDPLIEDVADGVRRIALPVPFPPRTVSAYVFEDGDAWTIVDTGFRSAIPAWERLLEGPLADRRVARVVATHHHPDHIGAAGWFAERFDAEIWTSRTAYLYARMLTLDAWDTPPPETERHYARLGCDGPMLERWRERARANFSKVVAPLPIGVRVASVGDRIAIGPRTFRVRFGQGHAPDHLVLIDEAGEIVVAGDQILPRISPNVGVYATEPNADPLGDWMTALVALQEAVDDAALILPGHGAPFRGGRQRMMEIYAEHARRLSALAAHLAEPRTAVACFDALYRRAIRPAEESLALNETLAHLNRLTASGRARRETAPDGSYRWRAD